MENQRVLELQKVLAEAYKVDASQLQNPVFIRASIVNLELRKPKDWNERTYDAMLKALKEVEAFVAPEKAKLCTPATIFGAELCKQCEVGEEICKTDDRKVKNQRDLAIFTALRDSI